MTTEFSRLDSALNVAKAMAQVAEASNPNFEGLLDKMGSIVPLMKHPDIRVKLALGRNLRRIEERAPERLYWIDPEGWRRALENARALEMDHPHDVQYQEVVEILEVILGEDPSVFRRRLSPRHKEGSGGPAGQVVLQVSQPLESDTRTALLPKVLQIDGVVSVTFEEGYIIVATRFVSTADPGFLSKLLKVVSDQGVHGANFFSVGEATGAVAATPFTASGAGSSSTSSTGIPTEADKEEDNPAQDPAYLDDPDPELKDRHGIDRGNASSSGYGGEFQAAGLPQWTFFSQRNWMMERRLQEYEDDPTIAARLALRKKQQKKKEEQEEAKRSGWLGLLNWMA